MTGGESAPSRLVRADEGGSVCVVGERERRMDGSQEELAQRRRMTMM
jgi:hypothetical protein